MAKTSTFSYDVIKIAMDVDLKNIVFVRQLDNSTAQPAQTLCREKFLEFMAQQKKLGKRVVSCYEAGCFGFGLHRQLTALGVENLVMAPQDWDKRGQKVKTDKRDAREMSSHLDRYVAGNKRVLAVVRVPTVDEELSRTRSRLRGQLLKERKRFSNRGKSLLLYYGLATGSDWWRDFPTTVAWIRRELPGEVAETVVSSLAIMQRHAANLEEDLKLLTVELCGPKESVATGGPASTTDAKKTTKKNAKQGKEPEVGPARETPRPEKAGKTSKATSADKKKYPSRIVGIGLLSMRILDDEIGDWNRFSNRRQVASYTGLCPGVRGSGGKFNGLSVTKYGNPRVRCILVEIVWLLVRYQPDYKGLQRWKEVFAGKASASRKKAAVAVARRLSVDLWRIKTGRTTPQALGLRLAA